MIGTLIEQYSLWTLLAVTFALVWCSTEIGYHTGLYRSRAKVSDDEQRINVMTASNLALMGFILVFSFNGAAEHHSARKALVLDEVNAIETAYLRADLAPPDIGRELQSLLRGYVSLRAHMPTDDMPLLKMLEETENLQTQIWAQMVVLGKRPQFGPREALLVDAVNEVLDIHALRVYAALNTRVPSTIWLMLFLVLMLAMFGMGYYSGMNGRRNMISRFALTLSVAMVVTLTGDLDRPTSGLVRGDLSTLQALSDSLEKRAGAGLPTPQL